MYFISLYDVKWYYILLKILLAHFTSQVTFERKTYKQELLVPYFQRFLIINICRYSLEVQPFSKSKSF